jgi:alpha-galactosidase
MKKEKLKLTFIGGGSPIWVGRVFADIASLKQFSGCEFCLLDIDPVALERGRQLCTMIAKEAGADIRITASLDKQKAIEGARYVIVCISTGGVDAAMVDLSVPLQYGIKTTLGDTTGPGGLNRALRNIPVFLDFARIMEKYAPEAIMLNASNPLAQISWAVTRETKVKVVGICHGVRNIMKVYANLAGCDLDDPSVSYKIGGIDHFNWLLDFKIGNQNGLEVLKAAGYYGGRSQMTPEVYDLFHGKDFFAIVMKMWEAFGCLPLISDPHFVEFMPGLCRASVLEKYGMETHQFRKTHKERLDLFELQLAGKKPLPAKSFHDNIALVISALEGHGAYTGVMNYPNIGQILNLQPGAFVETHCHVDATGIRPLASGPVPGPVRAMVSAHLDRYNTTIDAAIAGDFDLAVAALASDPQLPDAFCARPMLLEMMKQTKKWLPQFDLA